MSEQFRYRFQIILDYLEEQKQQAWRRFRQGTVELASAQDALQKAEVIYQQLQTVARQTTQKRNVFARQMLRSASNTPMTGVEIHQRLRWQEALDVDIQQADDRVTAQQMVVQEKQQAVRAAEERLRQAELQLNECRLQQEAFEKHKEKAQTLFQQTLEYKESLEQDDIGAILHQLRGM